MTEQFYVALPSNSSISFFPYNTQSNFRTKLASPLILDGDFECGIKEIFVPRNYFNIGTHNNAYSLTYYKEEEVMVSENEFIIDVEYIKSETPAKFWEKLNDRIKTIVAKEKSVKFVYDKSKVNLNIEKGFEMHFHTDKAAKLIYMLNLPHQDISIDKARTFNFRATNENITQTFEIVDKNPKSVKTYKIPIHPINAGKEPQNIGELVYVLSENIKLLKVEKYIQVSSIPEENAILLKLVPNSEISFDALDSSYFMKVFNIESGKIIKEEEKLILNTELPFPVRGYLKLTVKECYTILQKKKQEETLSLEIGMYKTPEILFNSFKNVHLSQLPNSKVKMLVPEDNEISFSRGLADMLGFNDTHFTSGIFISKYQLELHGSLDALYVYTDIISSYHIGDTFAKCLCVIPCMSEQGDQIVRHYQTPLYFPVSKSFIETIDIDIRTPSGDSIIFNGGKSYILMSFRKRRL